MRQLEASRLVMNSFVFLCVYKPPSFHYLLHLSCLCAFEDMKCVSISSTALFPFVQAGNYNQNSFTYAQCLCVSLQWSFTLLSWAPSWWYISDFSRSAGRLSRLEPFHSVVTNQHSVKLYMPWMLPLHWCVHTTRNQLWHRACCTNTTLLDS